MKLLSWDLECSNLNADFGIILCAGFNVVGESKPWVIRIDDYMGKDNDLIKAEGRMLKDISKTLLEADAWMTHFGTFFDVPFTQSRLVYHRQPVLPPTFAHIDTWKVSKNRLKLRNNRLVTIQDFLKTPDSKNSIKPEQWIRALGGHKPSLNYIVDHCRRDVLVLEQVYEVLKPLIVNHPHVGLLSGKTNTCGTCGSTEFQKRGFHLTRTRRYQRMQCKKCGAWTRATAPDKIVLHTVKTVKKEGQT